MHFSSYPGFIYSYDDFYVIRNELEGKSLELVVTETTYNTFNESKYGEFLKRNGEAVPTFIRSMIANWNCDSIV